MKDFGVLEFVLFNVFEDGAVLFDEIEKGVFPDGGDEVLLDEVVDPLVFLIELLVGGLLFFLWF